MLEEFADEHATARLPKVNVDENPAVAARYGITSIPTVYLFQKGQRTASALGTHPKQYFEKEFAGHLERMFVVSSEQPDAA